jgi:C-terminal processing protease CtpA/Prc
MRHVRNDYEATRLLQRMAAQLQDGHTFVWGDDGKHAIMPAPFTTKFLGGKVYIDRIMSSDMIKRGIQRGMELVSIDGQAVKDYAMKQIAPYVSSSTPQWTHHHTYEGYNLTKKPEGKSIRLKLRDGKQTHTIKYTIGDADWDLQEQNGLLHFSLLDNHVGYLRIESFNDSRVCQQFDTLYPRILETHALIIDLRDNGGGNSGNGDYILTHLSKDSIKTDSWRSPMYIPAYASWNMKQPWYESHSEYMQPAKGKTVYTKPIILLVNAGTFSAAEDFVNAMGWHDEQLRQQSYADGIERNLFPDLSPDEQKIVDLLQQTNDLQLNILSVKCGIPISQLTALLFQLEMKGVVKPLAGGMYHLLM